MDIDRRRLLLGGVILVGVPSAWASPAAERPRLRWSGAAALARSGEDAAVAPLALCDVEGGAGDPVLIEPDGTERTARIAGLGPEAVAERIRALILPDDAALARYVAARSAADPALELAVASAEGLLAPQAVDAVLANLVRTRLRAGA